MNARSLAIAMLVPVLALTLVGADSSLRSEMKRLGVRSALVLASEAVDQHPVWSPDGQTLTANVDGHWVKVDLTTMLLQKGTWHGDEAIGVATSRVMSPIAQAVVKRWMKSAKFDPRKVITRNGMTVELPTTDLRTSFLITKEGEATQTLWTSRMENCHSLALSPDEELVAYICELNGVIVTRLD